MLKSVASAYSAMLANIFNLDARICISFSHRSGDGPLTNLSSSNLATNHPFPRRTISYLLAHPN